MKPLLVFSLRSSRGTRVLVFVLSSATNVELRLSRRVLRSSESNEGRFFGGDLPSLLDRLKADSGSSGNSGYCKCELDILSILEKRLKCASVALGDSGCSLTVVRLRPGNSNPVRGVDWVGGVRLSRLDLLKKPPGVSRGVWNNSLDETVDGGGVLLGDSLGVG
jgi:hypothetical protein